MRRPRVITSYSIHYTKLYDIVKAEPVLGYIHRMHEKMAEAGSYAQFMPNTARMDYLHALAFNHGWALAVEKAAGIEVPERAEYIRVITVELNRIVITSYSIHYTKLYETR